MIAAKGCGMPTVAAEEPLRFVGQHWGNAFAPLHVHVGVGNGVVCGIELNRGIYLDQLPSRNFRAIIQENGNARQREAQCETLFTEISNRYGSSQRRQPDDDHAQIIRSSNRVEFRHAFKGLIPCADVAGG